MDAIVVMVTSLLSCFFIFLAFLQANGTVSVEFLAPWFALIQVKKARDIFLTRSIAFPCD
ncbi:MAG: hypothetical protein WB463_03320 [Pseudolabrys sp.]